MRIITTDPVLIDGHANGAAIYLGADVCRDGKRPGLVAEEPNCIIDQGRLLSMIGQARCQVSVTRGERHRLKTGALHEA